MKTIRKMGLAILVIGFLGLIIPPLEAAEINVKCDKGQSVQSALDGLTGPATLVVTGICYENIDIRKDDVTIQGGSFDGPDPEQTTIYVESARRVLITGATVTGAGLGIAVTKGGSLTLENSSIQGNAKMGVCATDNSALILTNCTITDNNGAGVLVQRSSSARIGRTTTGVLAGNAIKNNGGFGVGVLQGAYAVIDGNTITGNSANGVTIEGASASVASNTIGNNRKGITVQNSGSARVGFTEGGQAGPNTIENNSLEGIQVATGGAAYIFANIIRKNGLPTYRPGVAIYRASGELIGDNTIEKNGGHGVLVTQGTLFQGVGDFNLSPGPDLITKNGYSGIFGWNGASLDIRHLEVTKNKQNGISLSLKSSLRIYDALVSGNYLDGIVLYDGSSVARYGTDSPRDFITDNSGWGIVCYGGSNLIGQTSQIYGNDAGDVNCPPIIIPTTEAE